MAMLALCVLGSAAAAQSWPMAGPLILELKAVFRDPTTQWMVLACAGVYFVAFTVLRMRRTGSPFRQFGNPDLWLAAMMALAGLAYLFNVESASRTTDALTLLGAAAIGQGVAVWRGWGGKDGGSKTALVAGATVFLLLAGMFMPGSGLLEFQYRGQPRWTGAWDNPNTFGALMGVGVVLALGLAGERWRMESGGWRRGLRLAVTAIWLGAAATLAVGLIKSYSRGAWLATLVAVAYLLLTHASRITHHASRITRHVLPNWLPLTVAVASMLVIAFWTLRHTEHPTARRAFSVGNLNDFSWRNRVAAWEGTLQMMADKPGRGFGWKQPERAYDKLYRKPKIEEHMAIQMNDYLMLGTTLGLPALACFLVFVALSLFARERFNRPPKVPCPAPSSTFHPPSSTFHPPSSTFHPPSSTFHPPSSTFHPPSSILHLPSPMLHPRCSILHSPFSIQACRAAALLLLIAFWFDGGLFRLATGTLFWVVLALAASAGRPFVIQNPVKQS
jgi:O-antigen ligase